MDNQEINKVLAERVMGWTRAETPEGLPVWAERIEDGRPVKGMGYPFWNPTSDLNQAKLIIDKIVESGREVEILGSTMGYNVSFYEYRAGGKRKYLSRSGETTLPLAICAAAIQLVQEGK